MRDDLRRLAAQEQRDKARAQARRIIGNCSGESLVEAIADIAMFGEFDPLKPWHLRALAAAQGTPAAGGSRQCSCAIPDPVMQADRRFYCHTCSFQVPAVLCARCELIVPLTEGHPND